MKRTNLLKTLFCYCTLFGSVATVAFSLNTILNPDSTEKISFVSNPIETDVENTERDRDIERSDKETEILLKACEQDLKSVKQNGKEIDCNDLEHG